MDDHDNTDRANQDNPAHGSTDHTEHADARAGAHRTGDDTAHVLRPDFGRRASTPHEPTADETAATDETVAAGGEETSSFLERRFGDLAPRVAAALEEAVEEMYRRAMDAKAGSRLKTNQAYGATAWLALPHLVAEYVGDIFPDSRLLRPLHSQYPLLVLDEMIVLPAITITSRKSATNAVQLRPSDMRDSLLALNEIVSPQATVFDAVADNERAAAAHARGEEPDTVSVAQLNAEHAADVARAALSSKAKSTMVVAVVCTASTGPQLIHIGYGAMDADGFITWESETEHQVLVLADNPAHPTTEADVLGPVSEIAAFASGPKPVAGLALHEQTPTGSIGATEPSAPATPAADGSTSAPDTDQPEQHPSPLHEHPE